MKQHLTITLGLGLALACLAGCQSPAGAHARAEIDPLLAPMVEKRDTLTATGYAVISVQGHRNPAQQRLLAIRASKLDAYRSLAEQVYGLRMDSNVTVADMVVQSDTFRSRV